jgi:predicted GNAT family acetyltransferase
MKTPIRWAKATDIKSLLALDKLAHKEFPEWWDLLKASEARKLIGKSKFNVLIAEMDRKVIGFLRGEPSGKGKLTLEDMFVSKKLRNKGLGKQMMKIFLKKWKGKANKVGLHTKDFNVKKFERMGFEKKMNFMSREL